MLLTEVTELLNANDMPTRVHAVLQPWGYSASYDHVSVSEGGVLRSDFGRGATADEAVSDYASKLAGKKLMYSPAGGGPRKYLVLPREVLPG